LKETFEEKVKKKNKRVIAQYLSLYTENTHLKKAMITLTPPTGTLQELLDIRKKFFTKLGKTKLLKKDGDRSIKYFSVIEYTKTHQPHLHIQFFYTNFSPIKKAYTYIINQNNNIYNKISHSNNKNTKFNYVIKDFMNFDLNLEEYKHNTVKYFKYYHNISLKYITSSRKQITNDIVKYLYRKLLFKTKNKYQEILNHLENGDIDISKNYQPKIIPRPINTIERVGNYDIVIYQ
jgi:hypothetical protein